MLAESNPEEKERLKILWKEAYELTFIFNKISITIRENKNC